MFSGSGRYFFVAGFFAVLAAVGLPRGIGLAYATLRVLAFALEVGLAGLAAWPNSTRTSPGKVSKAALNSVRKYYVAK